MLLDYLNANTQIDNSVLLEYKKKLEEQKEDKIKEKQAYKKMIELIEALLKSNIKNTNDISNLKSIVNDLIVELDPIKTIDDFLQEHEKSQTYCKSESLK